VTHRDSRVSFLQEIGHWSAYNVAASKNDSPLSFDVHLRCLQENHDTFRSARGKVRFSASFCELSNIDSVEAVNVLEW
jgi:hypothetical protein